MDDEFMQMISAAITQKDMAQLAGQAVVELHRIANAQEDLLAITKMDVEAQIEETIQARAEQKADEIVAEKSKRNYIGKR